MSEFLSKNFDQTLKEFKISGKALAEESGASPSQISEFRKGKRNLSSAQLERVMVAMDAIAPGARLRFCILCAGTMSHSQLAALLNSVADRLDPSPSQELVGTLS